MAIKLIKYKNYEALILHKEGKRSRFSCDYASEAINVFKKSKTATKMILFVATHKNTRLKKFAEYGIEWK